MEPWSVVHSDAVKNTFIDISDPPQEEDRPKSDSEWLRRRSRSASPPRTSSAQADSKEPVSEIGLEPEPMLGTSDTQEGAKKRRPGKREREQLKGLQTRDADCQRAEPTQISWPPPSTKCVLSVLALFACACAAWSWQGMQPQPQLNVEQQAKMDTCMRPEEKLEKPANALIKILTQVTEQGAEKDHDAVISKLDNERFNVRSGAWKFRCKASARAKLSPPSDSSRSQGLPQEVVESIVSSLKWDEEVSTQQRNFQVDGRNSVGHMYHFRLQSTRLGGMASVALMAYGLDFDMQKVVDHYETSEEPVYEDDVYIDRFGQGQVAKKFVQMAQKKFPIYSHRALPENVSQADLMQALDFACSREATKILSA
ncbi:unnamed protein product [Effrenium voratum]|nr:unnamed protein product [Effrenium voratum]CAJ1415692.1 unnamed protein product [Effrenium voratum]